MIGVFPFQQTEKTIQSTWANTGALVVHLRFVKMDLGWIEVFEKKLKYMDGMMFFESCHLVSVKMVLCSLDVSQFQVFFRNVFQMVQRFHWKPALNQSDFMTLEQKASEQQIWSDFLNGIESLLIGGLQYNW